MSFDEFRGVVSDIPGGVSFQLGPDGEDYLFRIVAGWKNGAMTSHQSVLVNETVARQIYADLQAIFDQLDSDRRLEGEKAP